MPDIRRIVSLSAGGRPVVALNLEQTDVYKADRGTFQFQPGAKSSQVSGRGGRYGGGRVVGESRDLARVGWMMRVKATTEDQLNQRMEDLLGQVESTRRGRLLEWRPDGATGSSFLRIAGPGEWTPAYQWVEYVENVMGAQVSWPVESLVEWAPCTIVDPFDADSIGGGDYLFDALTASTLTYSAGSQGYFANGQLTSERRARNTARGYTHLEGEAVLTSQPVTTLTSYKGSVILRGSASNTYIEVYVDDNGTNSRLRIDVVIAGVRTNRQTTNLAARIVSGAWFWVVGRIVGQTVTAEYWTGNPTPMGTATLAPAGYTLTGGEQTSLVAGYSGFSWIPQNASAILGDFSFAPYVRRNVAWPTTPGSTQFTGIPGRAPAKADITLTASGGTQVPAFALFGWNPSSGQAPLGGSVQPFGLIEAETAVDKIGGWANVAEGNTSGGTSLRESGFSGARTYRGSWQVDPHALVPDEFEADTVGIEVWARVGLDAAVVSPKALLYAEPAEGTTFGKRRYSAEYGSAGKLLTKPSSASAWRFSKMGTLTLPCDPVRPRAWKIWIDLTCATGSSGLFGLDYLFCVNARSRALSPSGKIHDLNLYPQFLQATTQTARTIRHDLSGLSASPPNNPNPDTGLGGNLIEIPVSTPAAFDLAIKLCPHVPDDPTSSTYSEATVTHSASLQVDLTPRSFLLRG